MKLTELDGVIAPHLQWLKSLAGLFQQQLHLANKIKPLTYCACKITINKILIKKFRLWNFKPFGGAFFFLWYWRAKYIAAKRKTGKKQQRFTFVYY